MGSEQSHHQAPTGSGAPNSFTTGDLSAFSASLRERDGAMSPRQDSVCSDSEVPYVSYTVSKPIGESPNKAKAKSQKYKFSAPMLSQRSASTNVGPSTSTSSRPSYFRRSVVGGSHKSHKNTLVVVSKGASNSHQATDAEIKRLAK